MSEEIKTDHIAAPKKKFGGRPKGSKNKVSAELLKERAMYAAREAKVPTGPLPKGEDGKPSYDATLAEYLDTTEGRQMMRKAVRAQVFEAAFGNTTAADKLAQRLDGAAKSQTTITVKKDPQLEYFKNLPPDQLEAMARGTFEAIVFENKETVDANTTTESS